MIKLKNEINGVLNSSEEKQYEYFIKKVVDYEEIWGLYFEQWFTIKDGDRVIIPLWPKEEFIQDNIKKSEEQYKSKSIDIYDFIDLWIPKIIEKQLSIALFWDGKRYLNVDIEKFVSDLEDEMDNY